MLASASVLLLMHMIVILTLTMSTKFCTLITLLIYSISIVTVRISRLKPLGCVFQYFLVAVASLALVERVLFLRVRYPVIVSPHLAKMSDKLLELLAFCTCSLGNAI